MFAKSIILLSITALAQGRAFSRRQTCNDTSGDVAADAASIVFDGRLNANATAADFDSPTGPYGPDFVKGQSELRDVEPHEYPLRWYRPHFQRTGSVSRGRTIPFRCQSGRQGI
jgi:hypothetical protein